VRKLLLSVALGFLLTAPATAEDVVHDQIQKFLDMVRDGGEFANSEFKDAVKPDDAARFRTIQNCPLDAVKRSQGDTSALVLFRCPTENGDKTRVVMIEFENSKITSIEPVSYVEVPVKQ